MPPEAGAGAWAEAVRHELGAGAADGSSPGSGVWARGLPREVRAAVAERYSVARLVDDLTELYLEELRRT